MITEDYVSFETAKLLKEKGFYQDFLSEITPVWKLNGNRTELAFYGCDNYPWETDEWYSAPTLQMAMKWLEEVHHILVIPDYIYECMDTSWVYKTYRLGENGKPERCVVKGVSYDDGNNPTEHIVGYRDYELSGQEYATRTEAMEEGIKYCLENLI